MRTIMEWQDLLSQKEQELIGTPLTTSVQSDEGKEQYQKHMDILDWIAISQQNIDFMQRKAQRIWENCNVGEAFKDCTFDAFVTEGTKLEPVKAKCEQYAKTFNKDTGAGILLHGDYGVGKTHLVTAVANYLVYNYGVSAYFTSLPDLIARIQMAMRRYDENDDPRKLVKSIDILILDDLGREKSSDWSQQILFEIVDHRYRAKKPILITSNLNPTQLSYQVGEATMSRVINMSHIIAVNGVDYRISHRQAFEEVLDPIPF